MRSIDKMGVLVLMSHLVITVILLILYGFFVYTGKEVNTIEMVLMIVIGYWFGAIGKDAIRPTAQTQIHNAQEVKVNQSETEGKVG